ncbi:MAG: patatin-like phospholipase family protein [Spirochaetes bacterium]|nr:patatin-like phospholipase family protein [Spirochaetota bacterium]
MIDRMKYVRARVYDTRDPSFGFPELQLDGVKKRPNCGVAFSGGGTRSASLTLGQLRGLHALGVLEKFRYLSAVSGGAWTAIPYTFLDPAISDDLFLGACVKPEDLRRDGLREAPEPSMARAISRSSILGNLTPDALAGDESYAHLIANIFLKPFGLASEQRFFTWDAACRERILAQNLNLRKEDFHLANPGANRPFLIAGGIIIRPGFVRIPFDMTPLYAGVCPVFRKAGANGRFDIGGTYIEPHGFDSDSPESIDPEGNAYVRLGRPKHMFTLSDVAGTTGAAPAEYAERFGLGWAGFPEFKYWCLPPRPSAVKAKEYDFGDGGILENLGIMPLLKRKVERIIVFVNGETELLVDRYTSAVTISDSIPALFKPLKNHYGEKKFDTNVVFAGQEKEYMELVYALKVKLDAGLPPVVTGEYEVTPQPHYGIPGGGRVKVMWVYNGRVRGWTERLPADLRFAVARGDYGARFPNYRTFMENFPAVIDLKPEQVNLLAHLSSYNVMESASEIREFVGE